MDAILNRAPALLQAIFGTAADHLARQTGFVQRVRRLTPAAFAQAFCLFLLRHPHASLDQLAAQMRLTAAALCQRLRQTAAADVPADRLPAAGAWELYRCRWNIELLFKRWKSLG